jgi:uridine kinase
MDDGVPRVGERDLEERVRELEKQVATLAAAVDAASRMQVATPFRLNQDIRIAGGRLVRRILEKGRLVEDYREARRTK